MNRFHNEFGFTFAEIMAALAIVMVTSAAVIGIGASQSRMGKFTAAISTENRIVAGVRSLAGSPPALRASVIALAPTGNGAANQALLQCVGGNPPSSCVSGQVNDLTLYLPVVLKVGGVSTVTPLILPPSAPSPSRFDDQGLPCSPGENCPLIVSTQFAAQCGTQTLSSFQLGVGSLSPSNLNPIHTCTVADIINVTYTIQLDPAMASQFPELQPFAAGVSGSVATAVKDITGNPAQP